MPRVGWQPPPTFTSSEACHRLGRDRQWERTTSHFPNRNRSYSRTNTGIGQEQATFIVFTSFHDAGDRAPGIEGTLLPPALGRGVLVHGRNRRRLPISAFSVHFEFVKQFLEFYAVCSDRCQYPHQSTDGFAAIASPITLRTWVPLSVRRASSRNAASCA